jgi:hypothetical protein
MRPIEVLTLTHEANSSPVVCGCSKEVQPGASLLFCACVSSFQRLSGVWTR